MGFSPTALELFRARAIDPRLPETLGVVERDGALQYPNGRYRPLSGTDTFQPSKQPLEAWWFGGPGDIAVVCEGETDAFSAMSAVPEGTQCWFVALPGAGYPPARLVGEMVAHGIRVAFLLPDGDKGGEQFAERTGPALQGEGIDTRVAQLPEGSDVAAEMVKADDRAATLRLLLGGAIPAPLPELRAPRKVQYAETLDDLKALEPAVWVERLTGETPDRSGFMQCPYPDHDERTGSFKVFPNAGDGVWCFGCQRGGDIYAFAMTLWGCDFKAAKERLGEEFGS